MPIERPSTPAAEAEPAIPYVDETGLPDELCQRLERARDLMGFVPNSIRLYLHRPEIADLVMTMASTIVKSPSSTLSRQLKSRLGVICSAANGCLYCTSHQCSIAQHPERIGPGAAALGDAELTALITGTDQGADAVERICFEFARTASQRPDGVERELLERMKGILTSAQIVELAAVVGFWKFFNTIHDSLHLPSEAALSKYWEYLPAGA
jgi:uncharacterized peroxidase-related enzyme